MERLKELMHNNRAWVDAMRKEDPAFFEKLGQKQEPDVLFIGCSDSRVPETTITGARPGEMFVHRNIANQVYPADLNLLSVLQYAVEVLDVRHVIVCGHSGCGGVRAAMGDTEYGLVDNWLEQIREVRHLHEDDLASTPEASRLDRMVSLNVVQQIANLARVPLIQSAWRRGRRPQLHGMVYNLLEGLLRPIIIGVDSPERAKILGNRVKVVEAAWAGKPYYDPDLVASIGG